MLGKGLALRLSQVLRRAPLAPADLGQEDIGQAQQLGRLADLDQAARIALAVDMLMVLGHRAQPVVVVNTSSAQARDRRVGVGTQFVALFGAEPAEDGKAPLQIQAGQVHRQRRHHGGALRLGRPLQAVGQQPHQGRRVDGVGQAVQAQVVRLLPQHQEERHVGLLRHQGLQVVAEILTGAAKLLGRHRLAGQGVQAPVAA
jgi:hypothetical protein